MTPKESGVDLSVVDDATRNTIGAQIIDDEQSERIVQLMQNMCMLLCNLIDPVSRKMQVGLLETDLTIKRLTAMRDDCREFADLLDRREDPQVDDA